MVYVTRQRILFVIFLFALFLLVQDSLPEKAHATSDYYVASMDMDVNPGAQDFVVSSVNNAIAGGMHHFILILNTNGGNGANMENIVSAISTYKSTGVGYNFATLIAPFGAHAFSAGAYIAEASTNIFVVPGTTIGSATPIVYGIPIGEENTTLTKDINAFTAYMASLTPSYRNVTNTKLMVTKGVSYHCQSVNSCEAKQTGVVDQVLNANSTQEALTQLGAGNVEIHTPGITSLFLAVLSDPNLASILFLLGTFAILADVYHPTLMISVVGATAIALALLGLGVFGAPLISIILMIIAAGFIFLELKTHHGVSAIAGVIIFIVGFLLIFSFPAPAPSPSQPSGNFIQIGLLTYTILGIIGGGGVLGSLYLYKVRESLMHRPPTINPKAIIGKQGRLTSDLKAGEVATANIGSEDYTVTGSENILKGTQIKVKDVKGLKLVIEKSEA